MFLVHFTTLSVGNFQMQLVGSIPVKITFRTRCEKFREHHPKVSRECMDAHVGSFLGLNPTKGILSSTKGGENKF